MSDASGSSGLRRFLVWCFWIVFGVLVAAGIVGLVARAIFVHYTDRAWAEAVAEADAADPDWRWEQLEAKRAKISDEDNSALLIVRLRDSGLLKERTSTQPRFDFEPAADQVAARDVQGLTPETLPMPDEVSEQYAMELVGDVPPEVRLSPDIVRALERELTKDRRALTEAIKLADMPMGRHPITVTADFIGTILPTIQYCRTVAVLLALEATRRAEAGDLPGAMRATRACLNCGRSVGDEPFLITMLVRVALDAITVQKLERVLAQGEPSVADLAVMQAALEQEAAVPRLVQSLRGERAGVIKLCDAIIRGEVNVATLTGSQASSVGKSFAGATGELLARQARPEMLRLYTEMIETAQKPPNEWEDDLGQIELRVKDGAILTRLLMPAVIKVTQAEIRCRAILRTAVAGLAAERFRRARGRWPQDLRELADAGFLDGIPADPYTGEPLRLARKPFGLVVYSLGPDRADDGGLPMKWSAKPIGDIIFRVYEPRLRGATPEPLPMPRVNWQDENRE